MNVRNAVTIIRKAPCNNGKETLSMRQKKSFRRFPKARYLVNNHKATRKFREAVFQNYVPCLSPPKKQIKVWLYINHASCNTPLWDCALHFLRWNILFHCVTKHILSKISIHACIVNAAIDAITFPRQSTNHTHAYACKSRDKAKQCTDSRRIFICIWIFGFLSWCSLSVFHRIPVVVRWQIHILITKIDLSCITCSQYRIFVNLPQ